VRIAKPGSNQVMSFGRAGQALLSRSRSLSSTGYYKTPKIHWDGAAMKGGPFFYFSFGAAAAEVAIDTLTGEEPRAARRPGRRTAAPRSIPAIDLGQIEGAFVQGQGWLTCEELWWDKEGGCKTPAPRPTRSRQPRRRRRSSTSGCSTTRPTRERRSSAPRPVGEPPLMLATGGVDGAQGCRSPPTRRRARPPCGSSAPATPERILAALLH
jgi:xanthine dehydrogenase large subunit